MPNSQPAFSEGFEAILPEGSHLQVLRYKKWRQRIPIGNGLVTPGYISEFSWINSKFPTSLEGKSFLEVGANDGLNAFIAERRGAESVTAIDLYRSGEDVHDHQFGWSDYAIRTAAVAIQSKVDIHSLSVYDVAKLGKKFDVILLADVVTWLHDIPTAISALSSICNDTLIIREGLLKEDDPIPLLRYDHARTGTHMFTPNRQFFRDILAEMGFKNIEFHSQPSTATYDHWARSFPVVSSTKAVDVYEDPWAGQPTGEKLKIHDQGLLKIGSRVFARTKGWVNLSDVHLQWITNSIGGKAIKSIIGDLNYHNLQDRIKGYPTSANTIIARR